MIALSYNKIHKTTGRGYPIEESNHAKINKKFFEDFIVPSYLVGENFGRLIVRDYIRKGSKKNPFSAVWLCECKCGGRIGASTLSKLWLFTASAM